MRRLIAWMLGWRVVWLKDFDGTFCTRLARPNPFGGWDAWRMSRVCRIDLVHLHADGTVSGARYVKRWAFADSRLRLNVEPGSTKGE